MPIPADAFRTLGLVILVLSWAQSSASEPTPPAACDSIDKCIAMLRAQPASGIDGGMSQDEQRLAERLAEFEPDVVPRLVELLADEDLHVAEIAADALGDVKHIDARYLPQIRAGLDRKLGWLPRALCKLEGDAPAREAVARFLVSESAPHNQEAFAVEQCGRRAIPHILEAARCRGGCAEQLTLLAGPLHDMKQSAAEAVPGLLAIAGDRDVSLEVARNALYLLGSLQVQDDTLDAKVVALGHARPALAPQIDQVLVDLGTPSAGAILAVRLAAEPHYLTLRDLAETRSAGVDAGPVVTRLLQHEDGAMRTAAARTLGFIGYRDASSELIEALTAPEDVRLNWAAAESLGRLRAEDAADALRAVAATHWYPPVRRAATKAIEHIQSGTDYESEWHPDNFPFEFFEYEHIGSDEKTCAKPLVSRSDVPRAKKLTMEHDAVKLRALAYTVTQVSYGPREPPEPLKDGATTIVKLTPDNMVEHRKEIQEVPHVALRVDGGWLVGGNRGEWGGELVFIDDAGASSKLLEENVEDIHRLGDRIVALTGLAHLSMNEGKVIEVERVGGHWKTRMWRALPGAPQGSWLAGTGEILVDTAGGGSVLIDHHGAMRMVPCVDSVEETPSSAD